MKIVPFAKAWLVCLLLAGGIVSTALGEPETPRPQDADSAPHEVVLAENGRALFPIVVSPKASPADRENAATLAACLEKMTGAAFSIQEGDGSEGIVVGSQDGFSALPKTFDAAPSDPARKEEYLIATHPKGLLLVGASDVGAANALWDFLGRQGYRQYFPGAAWEIIPKVPRMTASFDEVQKPDYLMRSLWFSNGAYPERQELFEDWKKKNRMAGSFYINAGHSYEKFIARNKALFDANPEYRALVDGKRQGSKLNVAHPEVRRLFVEASLEQLRAHPEELSVSADPSDGGGWDESEEARAIGGPSNQAVFLANQVAEAVQAEFPGRFVGMYAYNEHAEPPTIKLAPNIFVLVATAFRGTNLSLAEQMAGWQAMGATLGIRDYLSYAAANYDIPNRCPKAFDFEGMARRLKGYHEKGARLYSGESSDNWGIYGLLYYKTARLLWDVGDAGGKEPLLEEFLGNCFGPVAGEIRPYFEALAPAGGSVLEPAYFRRLYDAIEAARAKNPSPEIARRLEDLTLYVRYLELYRKYSGGHGAARVEAARAMFSHLYRARRHSANSGYAIMRDLAGRDKILKDAWSPEEFAALRRGKPLWEKHDDYAAEEIREFSRKGVKDNPRLDFLPVSYSKDLVPAAGILEHDRDVAPGSMGHQEVHNIMFYTWSDEPGAEWRIKVSAENPVNDKTPAIHPRVELWAAEEAEDKPVSVAEADVEFGAATELVVRSPRRGLHWVVLSGARWQNLELDPGAPWTVTSLSDIPYRSQGAATASTLYFYVPKDTKIIGGHVSGRGVLRDPDGNVAESFQKPGYVKIEVPEGMDGRLWKVDDLRGGDFLLLTVPPYFATEPDKLLLPREVVEADQPKPRP